jgi:hypothetical protein
MAIKVAVHADGFVQVIRPHRLALLEEATGRVWFELTSPSRLWNCELECSCILLMDGYPIFLHPDRSLFGSVNDHRSTTIGSPKIIADKGSNHTGFALTNKAPLYLFDAVLENLARGVVIS